MATASQTTTGSAAVQGVLWGARARDFATQEPKAVALYEAVLEELAIGPGTRLLDIGCGPGLFLRLAALRGVTVSGIDAAGPCVEVARGRVPEAELVAGEMEALPFPDGCFDVVTGFTAFEFAADPLRALNEAARVGTRRCAIVIATWGRRERCEAAAYVDSITRLMPPPRSGVLGPLALSEPAAISELAAQAGLVAAERRDVDCVWEYPDERTVLCALRSTGYAVEAIEAVGQEQVTRVILEAIAPYRCSGGGYRLENVFGYVVVRKEG